MGRTDVRCTFLCAGIVLVAFLLVNPFVNFPFNDDWSYAFTVRKLLETGHILYNGWASAAIITQVYWGAAWAKIFGFSFVTLRFSTLPIAMGSVAICFLLGRICGLRPAPAVFAALMLGLSPIFMPLATSFMSDVMGLFFMLLSIYALGLSALTRQIKWIFIAVLAGIFGGMTRQVVWIVPLTILPYLLWIERKNWRFCAAAAAGWILLLIDVIATQRWFTSQHDVVIDPSLAASFHAAMNDPLPGLGRWGCFILTIFLLTLPVSATLVPLVANRCRHRIGLLLLSVLVGITLAVDLHFNPKLLLWPWSPNMLSPDGVLISDELSGHPPASMPPWLVTAWSVLVIIAMGASLVALLELILRPRALRSLLKRIVSPQSSAVTPIIMAIVTVAYLAILLVRSMRMYCFDRYALPMIPIVAIFTLMYVQREFPDSPLRRATFTICSTLFVCYSYFSLAVTQDLFALDRARILASDILRHAGAGPTDVAAGFEYDCWTQLEFDGQVNCLRAFHHSKPVDPSLGLTPVIWPVYRIEYSRATDTHPSRFPPVSYTSWLPPFHREIYIDKFLNPWWRTSPPTDGSSPESGLLDFEIIY